MLRSGKENGQRRNSNGCNGVFRSFKRCSLVTQRRRNERRGMKSLEKGELRAIELQMPCYVQDLETTPRSGRKDAATQATSLLKPHLHPK